MVDPGFHIFKNGWIFYKQIVDYYGLHFALRSDLNIVMQGLL